MDFIETLVIIYVIWSAIGSLISKNKKTKSKSTHKDNTSETSIDTLFTDLSGFTQDKLDSEILPTQSLVEQVDKPESSKTINSVEKPAKKVVPKEKVRSKSEFTPAFKHTEHVDESTLLHSPIPTDSDNDSIIDSPIYTEDLLKPSHIREAILLNEILNKPKALRNR